MNKQKQSPHNNPENRLHRADRTGNLSLHRSPRDRRTGVMMNSFTAKLVAEFLGTCALVFIGAGAVIVESHTGMSHLGNPDGKVGLVGIALAHGFVLMGSIFAFGSISGAHFNPAVSFAMWLRAKLDVPSVTGYVVAQLAGALTAAVFLAALFPDEIALAGLGAPSLAPKFTALKGLAIEGAITFLLTMVVLFVTRDDGDDQRFAGLAIGGTLVALILFAGPITGGSANPARYLGPAAITGDLKETFIYLVGPLIGAALASLSFTFTTNLSDATDGEETAPAPETSASARGARAPTVQTTIRRARELFRIGEGEEAAKELLPLLQNLEDLSTDALNSVRTLLVVIEEESGRLELLDGYRHIVDATP